MLAWKKIGTEVGDGQLCESDIQESLHSFDDNDPAAAENLRSGIPFSRSGPTWGYVWSVLPISLVFGHLFLESGKDSWKKKTLRMWGWKVKKKQQRGNTLCTFTWLSISIFITVPTFLLFCSPRWQELEALTGWLVYYFGESTMLRRRLKWWMQPQCRKDAALTGAIHICSENTLAITTTTMPRWRLGEFCVGWGMHGRKSEMDKQRVRN